LEPGIAEVNQTAVTNSRLAREPADDQPLTIGIQDAEIHSTTHVNFGSRFPMSPHVGEMFMRTDSHPNATYRYNGDKWVKIHIEPRDPKYLVPKLMDGDLIMSDLSTAEQLAVRELLADSEYLDR
jgi:hypothetical protein